MWNFMKRCPFLCCVTILFLALCIIGINKGDGITKEDALAYVNQPFWQRAFDDTLTDTVQFEEEYMVNEENAEQEDAGRKDDTKIQNDTEVKNETETKEKGKGKENKENSTTSSPAAKPTTANPNATGSAVSTKTPNKKGTTTFKKYKPKNIQSPYYSDVGMTAMTTDYPYKKVDDSYFKDAAFIGDSRMLGLHDYTSLKEQADFFCESGFSLFQWTRGEKVTWKNKNQKVDLETIMKNNTYKKVYITIGMNDLGYGNEKNHGKWMKQLVDMIQKNQKDVIIYLIGNLHMSKARNNPKTEFNNINVNARNVETAKLADGEHIFYLDVNPLFTDTNGFLKADLTADGCHVYGYCYEEWAAFLRKHAIK